MQYSRHYLMYEVQVHDYTQTVLKAISDFWILLTMANKEMISYVSMPDKSGKIDVLKMDLQYKFAIYL